MGTPCPNVETQLEQIRHLLARVEGATFKQIAGCFRLSKSGTLGRMKVLTATGKVYLMDYGRQSAYFLNQEAAVKRIEYLKTQSYNNRLKRNKEWRHEHSYPNNFGGQSFMKPGTIGISREEFRRLDPIIPENVKITIVPWTPDRRYFVDPNIIGEFGTEWLSLRAHK